MLARTLEKAGLSTVFVTNMPFWAEILGVPRTFAVEHPFGHILGQPHNIEQQLRVILNALEVLVDASEPGTIIYGTEVWPVPTENAIKDWQPEEPSPVISHMSSRIKDMIRKSRKK